MSLSVAGVSTVIAIWTYNWVFVSECPCDRGPRNNIIDIQNDIEAITIY